MEVEGQAVIQLIFGNILLHPTLARGLSFQILIAVLTIHLLTYHRLLGTEEVTTDVINLLLFIHLM